MDILTIYKMQIKRREFQLNFFEEVDEKIFHSKFTDDTWSPEAIYRHFMMSDVILRNIVKGEKNTAHPLAIMGGPNALIDIEDQASLDVVRKALEDTSQELIKIFENTSEERWNERITNFAGKEVSIEEQVLSLMLHDSEHLGEIKWIFKRMTGWDDMAMYKMKK
jgi:hypothetical protein